MHEPPTYTIQPILQDYYQLNYSGSLSENYESSLRIGHSTFFLFRKSYQQMEPTGPRSCWLRHCKFFKEQPRAHQEIKDGLLHGSSSPLSLMATSDCFSQVRPHLVSYLVSMYSQVATASCQYCNVILLLWGLKFVFLFVCCPLISLPYKSEQK